MWCARAVRSRAGDVGRRAEVGRLGDGDAFSLAGGCEGAGRIHDMTNDELQDGRFSFRRENFPLFWDWWSLIVVARVRAGGLHGESMTLCRLNWSRY